MPGESLEPLVPGLLRTRLDPVRTTGCDGVGERPVGEILLGVEMSVEGAVGEPGVAHDGDDRRSLDALLAQPACRGVEDPVQRLLFAEPAAAWCVSHDGHHANHMTDIMPKPAGGMLAVWA